MLMLCSERFEHSLDKLTVRRDGRRCPRLRVFGVDDSKLPSSGTARWVQYVEHYQFANSSGRLL